MAQLDSRDGLAEVLRSAHRGAAQLADVLRGLDQSTADAAQVGEWTLSQTMAHVIGTARLYRRVLTGWASPLQVGGLPTLNAGYMAGLVEDRPRVLADLLEEAADSYAAKALEIGPDTLCNFHLGLQVDVVTVTAFLGNEVLMHGWDIAHVVGTAFVDDEAALPVLAVLTPLTAAFIDPEALKTQGRVALCPQGGAIYGHELSPDGATYIGGDSFVEFDCLIHGSAFALLLWRNGRLEWDRAGLETSGPRPDLGPAFAYMRF
jgi:uncharacterized protein (TIGR03083 family)